MTNPESDLIDELLQRFGLLKENFGLGVNSQTLVQLMTKGKLSDNLVWSHVRTYTFEQINDYCSTDSSQQQERTTPALHLARKVLELRF